MKILQWFKKVKEDCRLKKAKTEREHRFLLIREKCEHCATRRGIIVPDLDAKLKWCACYETRGGSGLFLFNVWKHTKCCQNVCPKVEDIKISYPVENGWPIVSVLVKDKSGKENFYKEWNEHLNALNKDEIENGEYLKEFLPC